ncbi:MAG: TetR family transcriptional regulator [Microbacterium sp.]
MAASRNADATRARILSAATAEFAAHGLAGGRVDRIAAEAEANVRMIYAYFGGKDALFDAAVAGAITDMAAAVPPVPGDLAGWAGRLFDFHARQPSALRINLWAQLERPASASEPLDAYLAKTNLVAAHATIGIGAVDLLTIIYAVAQAWYLTPVGLLRSDGSDPDDHERLSTHRDAVVLAVQRMISS